MKKHKIKGNMAFGCLMLAVAVSMFYYRSVYAAEDNTKNTTTIDCSGYTDQAGKDKCEQDAKTCITKLNEANYQFITNLSEDKTKITYKITSSRKITATYNVDVKITLDNSVFKEERISNIEGNKEYTYVLPNVGEGKNYFVNLVATVNSSTSVGGDMHCEQYYKGTSIFNIGNVSQDKFENPYMGPNGKCTQYKNGTLFGDQSYAYNKIKDLDITVEGRQIKGGEYFDLLFPYCSQQQIEYLMTEKEVEDRIRTTAQSVNATHIISSSSSAGISVDPKYINVDEPKNTLKFYCDAFGTLKDGTYVLEDNKRYFYHKTSNPVEATYKTEYNGKKTTKVCDVECVETVEATYGPPVAVKGSICFEYEITVKSKSQCAPKFNKEVIVPKKTEYKLCNPVPVCNQHGSLYRNQAGPNEEFDQCIMELDGGKYKQSSINKCYNKVYKKQKNVVKQSLGIDTDNESIMKIAKSNDSKYDGACKLTNKNAYEVAQIVYNMYTKDGYQGGYYEENNGVISWKSCNTNSSECTNRGIKFYDGCYWNDYARYYMASSYSYTLRNVMDDVNYYKNYSGVRSGWDYTSTYYSPKNGFKWAYYGTGSNPCNDKCVYTTSSCSSQNSKLNPSDTTKKSDTFDEDMAIYNSKVNECNSKIACDTSKETKYTMTVNHSTKNSDLTVCTPDSKGKENCQVWYSTNKKGNQITQITDNKQPLKNATGICYGSDKNDTDYQYINVISFPGSWTRDKSGLVRYDFKHNTVKSGYTAHNNEYCVSPSAGNVNDKWWTWDQVGWKSGQYGPRHQEALRVISTNSGDEALANKDYVNLYEKSKDSLGQEYFKLTNTNTKGTDKTNGYYNIFGKMEDFGYFNWNVEFNCFYAINHQTTPPTTTTKKDCKGDCCDDTCTKITNTETRTITLDDPFPSAQGVSNKLKDDIIPKKLNNTTTKENVVKVDDPVVTSEAPKKITGRTPGYNWSCDATNLKIKDYEIVPVALTLKISEQGNKIYNESSGELDYKITISPTQIKKIREYNNSKDDNNKDSRDYLTYSGKYTTLDGTNIKFYESTFLKDYTSIATRAKGKCNNFKNNGTACDDLSTYKEKAKNTCPKMNEI